jgi:hypothetical protein
MTMTTIRLDPNANDVGTLTAVTTPPPVASPTVSTVGFYPPSTPAAPPAAPFSQSPPVDPTRDILSQVMAERAKLQIEIEQYHREKAERETAAEASRLKLVAEKEGAEKALEEQRTKLIAERDEERRLRETERQQRLNAERDRAVTSALGSVTWVNPESHDAARRLLLDQFEARVDAAGQVHVIERATNLPAEGVIAKLIDQPPYTSLRAPTSQGGTGPARVTGGHAPQAIDTSNMTGGELTILKYQQLQAASQAQALANGELAGNGWGSEGMKTAKRLGS